MVGKDKPIHVIVNPHSGYGGQKLLLGELRQELRRYGWETQEYVTRWAGDATHRVRKIAPQASAVIAWGGDGTANEVASGLLGTEVPMLVVRGGTENLMAKELRMPKKPADLVDVIRNGRVLPCDIGLINGQSFHSILGVGFDAEVVRRVSASRTGHISHLSYFWPIWRTFWEHDFPNIHIVADGEEVFNGQGLAFVGNISRYSSGLRICRDARFDDGLLDLVVFKCNDQTGLLLHATWTLLRRHPLKGNVIYRHAKHIHIETEKPLTCEVDGDVGPVSPLDISIAPHKIRLIVPDMPTTPGPWSLWPWKGDAPL